jgi:hypothetical protein
MKINSDINIIGGLPDLNLIKVFLDKSGNRTGIEDIHHSFTSIKTDKAVKRFERAIKSTMLKFHNDETEAMIREILSVESVSQDSLRMLFWNACYNNDLLNYLNHKVFFPAFYSGRITIKLDEVTACILDLKSSEPALRNWSDSTIDKTASKYLTLLRKFGLMEGGQHKTILHPYQDDKMLMLFVYWLKTIELKPNLLESPWLLYSFSEKQVFIERVLQKKYSSFIHLTYTGDNLKIDPVIPYENFYHALVKS